MIHAHNVHDAIKTTNIYGCTVVHHFVSICILVNVVRFLLCRSARALYDCDAEDSLELSFKKDEILYNGTHVPALIRSLIIIMFPPFISPFLLLPHFPLSSLPPSLLSSLPSLVTESEEPDWLKAARSDGQRGLVPANYLEILP